MPFLKPKPSTGSAFCPVISKSYNYEKRASLCSQEVCRTMNEYKHSLNDSNFTQSIETSIKERPQSPIPDDKGQDFTSADAPHTMGVLLSPQTNNVRAISPNQLVTFPPEIPSEYPTYLKPSTLNIKNKTSSMNESPVFTTTDKTNSKTQNITSHSSDEYSKVTDLKYLPKFHGTKGLISMAMEIAPDRPFTPVAVTEPIITRAPWVPLPIENKYRPESPLVVALKTAPERSYSPLPTFTYASELSSAPMEEQTKEFKKSDSVNKNHDSVKNVDFSSPDQINTRLVGNNPVRYIHGYNTKTPATSLQNNKLTFQPILDAKTQKEHSTNLEFKTISSSFNKSLPSGLSFNPVENQYNYNKLFVTGAPDFKETKTFNIEHLRGTFDQNDSLNSLESPQHLSFSNIKLTSNKTLSPGIKNKVSDFTSNCSIINAPIFKQLSTDQVNPKINKSNSITENLNIRQNNYPNSTKLTKAVPFFSNSASSFTSPTEFP